MDFVAIVGISGAGKTTLGKLVAKALNYDYLDLDSFYLPTKPKVDIVLDNKVIKVSNWDNFDAIDVQAFRLALSNRTKSIIVTGFVLPDSIYTNQTGKPRLTIWLRTGFDAQTVINRAIEARLQSKGFDAYKAAIDKIIVRDYVYPFFVYNLNKTTIDIIIDVYDGNRRRSVDDLVSQLLLVIKTLTSNY